MQDTRNIPPPSINTYGNERYNKEAADLYQDSTGWGYNQDALTHYRNLKEGPPKASTPLRFTNSTYFKELSYVLHAIIVACIVVVWAVMISSFSNVDGVALYTFDWALPNLQLSYTATYPPAHMAEVAEMNIMDFCLTPDLYKALQGAQPDINTQYNPPSTAASSALVTLLGNNDSSVAAAVASWQNLFISSWNPNSLLTLQYDDTGGLNQPPLLPSQHFSPVCRCMYTVLKKYERLNTTHPALTNGANNMAMTQSAIQACLGTVQNIPRQKLIGVGDLSTTGDIPSTKSISRSTLLLIMGLAMLLGLVYRMWVPYVSLARVAPPDPETPNQGKPPDVTISSNAYVWLASLLILLLMVLIPLAAAHGVNMGNAMAFACLILLPGGALVFVVELSWYLSTELTNHRRFVYMHPLVFFVTLTTMYMLALVENGVYTMDNYLTYYFVSVAISIVYAIVIQCAHAKVFDRSSTNMVGFVLFLFVAGLASGYHQNPYFPTNQGLNFLWSLPVWFCVIFFATIVILERLFEEDHELTRKQGEMLAFTQSGHILQLAHYAFVVVYLIYFLSVIFFQVEGGSALLSNANRLYNRVNFDLLEDATPQYIKASPWGRYVNF